MFCITRLELDLPGDRLGDLTLIALRICYELPLYSSDARRGVEGESTTMKSCVMNSEADALLQELEGLGVLPKLFLAPGAINLTLDEHDPGG
jgi:hypothetical protein